MNDKRKRTESPEPPGFLFGKRYKSDPPTAEEILSLSNCRSPTRGVETLPLDPQADLLAVTGSLISNLAREGKRFVKNSLKVLDNHNGGRDITVQWVLDFKILDEDVDHTPINMSDTTPPAPLTNPSCVLQASSNNTVSNEQPLGGLSNSFEPTPVHPSKPDSDFNPTQDFERSPGVLSSSPSALVREEYQGAGSMPSELLINIPLEDRLNGAGSLDNPFTIDDDQDMSSYETLPATGIDVNDLILHLEADDDPKYMVVEAPHNTQGYIDLNNEGDQLDSSGDIDSDSESEDRESESGPDDEQSSPYIHPPQSPTIRHSPVGENEPSLLRLRSPEPRPRVSVRVPITPKKLPTGKRRTLKSVVLQPKHPSDHGSIDISLPLPVHGRARRILDNGSDVWTAITMGGDAQFISNGLKGFRLLRRCSMPGDTSYHVEDVCSVGKFVVVGYGRHKPPSYQHLSQIRMICLANFDKTVPPGWISLHHRPHSHKGVKSLASIDETKFLSGGYDQRVHLWTLGSNNEPDSYDLKVFFRRGVETLSYIPFNRTVLGASQNQLKVFDIEKPTDRSFRMSQKVHNIHTCSDHPDVVVLEVDDLDEQIHVYDRRRSGFGAKASMKFGHRVVDVKRTGGRYTKGAVHQCYFSRGYHDGTLKLWDFRTAGAGTVSNKLEANRNRPIVHTMFSTGDLVAFGQSVVSVYKDVV